MEEVMHRNTVAYAELKFGQEREVYQSWLEIEGILLANNVPEKNDFQKNTLHRLELDLFLAYNSILKI